MTTAIQVQDETWEALNQMKPRGTTFDDVVQQLLKQQGDTRCKNKKVTNH